MGNLEERIKKDYMKALKNKDSFLITAYRQILSAIQYKSISARGEGKNLEDPDIIEVLRKEAKKREESIEAFKKGKRDDLVEKESKELALINNYLPQLLSESELSSVIKQVIDEHGRDFGKIMKFIMANYKGRVDGAKLSQKVKEILQQ